MEVLVDTSAFYASLNSDDAHHESAKEILEDARHDFITSNYVVAETANLLYRRKGPKPSLEFLKVLEAGALFQVFFLGPKHHGRAVEIFEERGGLGLSFMDCSSLALMEERGLKSAFTFDRDFQKAGVDCLP